MNINLGAPYEAIIAKYIKKGYAGSKTEVLRQALRVYDDFEDVELKPRRMGKEERRLVAKAVEHEMKGIREGTEKGIPWEEVKKKYNL